VHARQRHFLRSPTLFQPVVRELEHGPP
jgi:hypothetical protein